MKHRMVMSLAALLAGFSSASALEASPSGGLRAMCYAPVELAARAGEQLPQKRHHDFDRPQASRALSPFAPVPQNLRGAIRRVALPKGSPKLVALTFDMCEQPGEIAGYDGAIIDYLRANGIKATIFTGGKWMRSHAERARQLMSDPLFEIASHSEAHRNLRLLSGAALREEIAGPQRAYEALREGLVEQHCVAQNPAQAEGIPQRMTLFRFPYGACNPRALDAVNDAGLLAIQWDHSTGDPSPGQSARAIAQSLAHVKPGSIVVMHANGRGHHTAEALPMALPKLKEAGVQFVTLSELLAAGTPEIASTCYDSRPGDTDRYDHPLGLRQVARKLPAGK